MLRSKGGVGHAWISARLDPSTNNFKYHSETMPIVRVRHYRYWCSFFRFLYSNRGSMKILLLYRNSFSFLRTPLTYFWKVKRLVSMDIVSFFSSLSNHFFVVTSNDESPVIERKEREREKRRWAWKWRTIRRNNSYLHEYVFSDVEEALEHQIELTGRSANRIKSLSATLHSLAMSDEPFLPTTTTITITISTTTHRWRWYHPLESNVSDVPQRTIRNWLPRFSPTYLSYLCTFLPIYLPTRRLHAPWCFWLNFAKRISPRSVLRHTPTFTPT